MANDDLDAFLSNGATPPPEPAPLAPVVEATPPPVETPAAAVAPAQAEDDAEPPEPVDGEELVPRRAFDALRHQRHDWKAKAIEAETKRAELERQLNEAKAAANRPPPMPAPVPEEVPNPAVDPAGYHAYVQNQIARDATNQRLNMSEMLLRREKGAEAVDSAIAEFKVAAERDPGLFRQLYSQPDPYGWAYAHVERLRLLAEVGDDPAAFKAKIEADARAKWEAERAIPAPRPVSPAAGMAPSLANARSVAGRSAPTYTGPTPLEAIFGR